LKFYPLFLFPFLFLLGCNQGDHAFYPTNDPPPKLEGYELVWNEEFNTNGKPNPMQWSYEMGFKRNNELQWYQPENVNIRDGVLVIEGKRERVKNKIYDPYSQDWRKNIEFAEYTSGSINTSGKKAFQYGIFECRARIDTAMGMWPAIWTLGESKGWPANGEIDLMEYYLVKGEPTILANAAWAHENKKGCLG
jgi:beta-glucanase (GH16 family)